IADVAQVDRGCRRLRRDRRRADLDVVPRSVRTLRVRLPNRAVRCRGTRRDRGPPGRDARLGSRLLPPVKGGAVAAAVVTVNVVAINGAQSFSPNPATLPAAQMIVWHNVD